jgi:hypothetical protein
VTDKTGPAGDRPREPTDAALVQSEAQRAWWDIEGIELPAADYQLLPVPASKSRDAEDGSDESGSGPVGIVGHLQNAAEPMASVAAPFVDHIVAPVAEAIGGIIEAAGDALSGSMGASVRWLRRRNQTPLANLYEVHPDARQASPRELGMRFVPIAEIRGTAVAGIAQRGADFLPLKPFRGLNWEVRWRRIRGAYERLESLPPLDLVKFDGEYWVLDGHNRIAATLYTNGAGVDAMVTEMVPLGGQASERPTALLSVLGEAGAMRMAGRGLRPAVGMRQAERAAEGAADLVAEAEDATRARSQGEAAPEPAPNPPPGPASR